MIVPDRLVTTLNYLDDFPTRTNAGVAYTTWRYVTNGVFDPDTGAGGTVTGFTQIMALYTNYRVRSFGFEWEGVNLDTNPLIIGHFASNTDVGGNVATFLGLLEQGHSQKKLLAGKGGMDRAQFKYKYNLSDILGDVQPETEQAYVGTLTANPTSTLFHNFGVYMTTGTLTNGVSNMISLHYEVEFFNRKAIGV